MGEMNQLKIFTVEEANAIIPKISELIKALQTKRNIVFSKEVEIDVLEIVTDKNTAEGSARLNALLEDYQNHVTEFYAAVDEIHALGCLLKDLDMGLIDFYSLYQNRVVYLCWKIGDPDVAHWHEIGRGYIHRKPLVFDGEE